MSGIDELGGSIGRLVGIAGSVGMLIFIFQMIGPMLSGNVDDLTHIATEKIASSLIIGAFISLGAAFFGAIKSAI